MNEMLDAIVACIDAGANEDQLQSIRLLQRKSMWRLDYISIENSKGFHASRESVRVLAESIDFSRQASSEALQLLRMLHLQKAANESASSSDSATSTDSKLSRQ